jgi:hypothetical protein
MSPEARGSRAPEGEAMPIVKDGPHQRGDQAAVARTA